MNRLRLTSLLGIFMLVSVSSLRAAAATDAAGHWEGAIHAPFGDVVIEVDLGLNGDGTLMGTFSNPGEQLKGLPLWNVSVEGRSMSLQIKAGAGGGTLRGTLSADGRSFSGDYLTSVYAVPFSLTRTGDARIEPEPRSAPIDKGLEGVWSGTLDVGGDALEIVLTMTNHADGTATGSWASNHGVAIPIAIAHQTSGLTLTSRVSQGRYSGAVNPEGTEIVGTFTEKQLSVPLTFRRASVEGGK